MVGKGVYTSCMRIPCIPRVRFFPTSELGCRDPTDRMCILQSEGDYTTYPSPPNRLQQSVSLSLLPPRPPLPPSPFPHNQKATLTVSHSPSIDHINITNRDTPSINPKSALTLQHPHSNRLHRPKNTLCLSLSLPPPLLLSSSTTTAIILPPPPLTYKLVDTTLPRLTSPKLS